MNKICELLGGKDMYLPKLRKIVARDVGGVYGAWGEEEKAGLRWACGRVGVLGEFV